MIGDIKDPAAPEVEKIAVILPIQGEPIYALRNIMPSFRKVSFSSPL